MANCGSLESSGHWRTNIWLSVLALDVEILLTDGEQRSPWAPTGRLSVICGAWVKTGEPAPPDPISPLWPAWTQASRGRTLSLGVEF